MLKNAEGKLIVSEVVMTAWRDYLYQKYELSFRLGNMKDFYPAIAYEGMLLIAENAILREKLGQKGICIEDEVVDTAKQRMSDANAAMIQKFQYSKKGGSV